MTVPSRVIDTHTHIFNARYLPLAGVVRPHVGGFLATRLDRLVNRLTGRSDLPEPDRARKELEALSAPPDAHGEPTLLELAAALHVDEIVEGASARVDERFASLPTESAPTRRLAADEAERLRASDEVLRILEEVDAYRATQEPGLQAASFTDLLAEEVATRTEIRLSTTPRRAGRLAQWARRVVRWLVDRVLSLLRNVADFALDYVRFVCNLLRSEKAITQRLDGQYSRVPQPPMAYFHFMMDMEYAYTPPDQPYYGVMEQLRRMHGIQVLSQGRLLGFAAFDPRRREWRQVMDEAIRLGFLGIKFYPPMGYRPAGNDSGQLERTMDDFFQWAEDHQVPVVAHCSPTGFQAYKGSGKNGHPRYWRARLKKNPELRLILLHAGGARQHKNFDSPGWFARDTQEWDTPDNFARLVCELCREFSGVYTEISHFHEALKDSDEARNLAANLRREITSEAGDHPLADKIMYGSDWHMPRIADEADDYLELYFDIMKDDAMAPYRERFFWKNALTFLRLDSWEARLDGWGSAHRPGSRPPESTRTYVRQVVHRVGGSHA